MSFYHWLIYVLLEYPLLTENLTLNGYFGKQCRNRSNATEGNILSESTRFAEVKTFFSETEMQNNLEILICDPLKYIMDQSHSYCIYMHVRIYQYKMGYETIS